MALKVIIFAAVALAVVNAQIPGFGSCPDYKPVADFDIKRFLGTWYENQRYFTLTEVGTRCGRIEYSQAPNGKFIAANTITSRLTGVTRVVNGELKVASDSKEGRLTIRYDQLPLTYNSEYSVVATDYDTYAILWSCSAPLPYLLSTQNAWLMTRDSDPDAKVLQIASAEFDKLGISTRFISRVDQKSCTEAAAAAAAAAGAATTGAAAATTQATVEITEEAAAVRHAVHDQQVHVKSAPIDAEVNQVDEKMPVVDAVVAETKPVVDAVVAETKPVVDAFKAEAAEATPEPEPVKAEEEVAAVAEPEPAVVAEEMKVEEAKPVEEKKPIKAEKKKE